MISEKKDPLGGGLPKEFKPGKQILSFILSFVASILLTFLLREPGFTDSQDYVLFLLFFSIGLWLTEAIPPFAVGLFIMAYLVFALGNPRFNSNPENVTKYVHTFSSSIIWLMLGGFFLAEAMTKTGVDLYFFRFSIRLSGKVPKNILLGLMLTTMLASMILSNTATTSMVIASVMPLLRSLGEKNTFGKSILVGIPLAASVGGLGTIIGSPTNAIAVGALENIGISVNFLKWMSFGVPLALIFTLAGWWLLKTKFITDNTPIAFELPTQNEMISKKLSSQRTIVLVILIVTILLWMTSTLHHLSVSAVATIPIVFLTMTGILQSADIRKIPWDTLLLVAGGLSLGLSLQETHLLEHFAKRIMGSGLTIELLFLVLAYVTMVFSNIMSNTATSTILIPLGIYLVPDHANQVAIVVGLAASTALLLPVSTPPNAIAYSTGLVQQKDFLPGGLLIGLLGPLLILLCIMLMVK
jgi:solute carrier family 13 (sodium-dependent dicarboxylate transporter), member 2/3/5